MAAWIYRPIQKWRTPLGPDHDRPENCGPRQKRILNIKRARVVVAWALALSSGAFGEPYLIAPQGNVGVEANQRQQRATPARYLIAWEGDDWPENQGWTRSWGNWQGQYQGFGAYRTLENGILTYDSLYDPGVCDFYYMENFGPTAPGANEKFVFEWRLKVDVVSGAGDPGVGLKSHDG